MLFYSIAAIVTALVAGNIKDTWQGFLTILSTPAQLTMDYFKLGTVGGAFLNMGLVGLATTFIFFISGFEMNGFSFLAFFLTIGFGFFGMNFMNIWPCFLGTWIFSKVRKVSFASQANMAVFSTALAPIVSEMILRYPLPDNWIIKILMGILVGAFVGFMMPIICMHGPNLHKGYSNYNAAVGAGFISIFLFAVLYKAAGVELPTNTDIGDSHLLAANCFAIATSVICIVAGFWMNGRSFKGYGDLLKTTGYKVDFTSKFGVPVTMINIGVFCLYVTAYYNLIGSSMTGPTMGAIICFLAGTACGGHILNMLPIMLGYVLAAAIFPFQLTTQAIIVALCYTVAMVPISGRFGSLAGIIAGMIHATIVTTVVTFHGGFLLYNGGFTCAITVIMLLPVLELFFDPQDHLALLPKLKKKDAAGK